MVVRERKPGVIDALRCSGATLARRVASRLWLKLMHVCNWIAVGLKTIAQNNQPKWRRWYTCDIDTFALDAARNTVNGDIQSNSPMLGMCILVRGSKAIRCDMTLDTLL